MTSRVLHSHIMTTQAWDGDGAGGASMPTDVESAHALSMSQDYLALAIRTRDLGFPGFQHLFSFAARQMAAYVEDGELWHVMAATAAAREVEEMRAMALNGESAPATAVREEMRDGR